MDKPAGPVSPERKLKPGCLQTYPYWHRIEDALSEAKINYTRLDGGMHRTERTKALSTFKSDMSCEVLLVSLRAGGVGWVFCKAAAVGRD